jgi:hypothetical protein
MCPGTRLVDLTPKYPTLVATIPPGGSVHGHLWTRAALGTPQAQNTSEANTITNSNLRSKVTTCEHARSRRTRIEVCHFRRWHCYHAAWATSRRAHPPQSSSSGGHRVGTWMVKGSGLGDFGQARERCRRPTSAPDRRGFAPLGPGAYSSPEQAGGPLERRAAAAWTAGSKAASSMRRRLQQRFALTKALHSTRAAPMGWPRLSGLGKSAKEAASVPALRSVVTVIAVTAEYSSTSRRMSACVRRLGLGLGFG